MTEKQRRFCEEYVKNGGHGTNAYLAAYDGSSTNGAAVEATNLLKRTDIQELIAKLRKPIEQAIKRKVVSEREYKKNLIQQRIDECVARGDDAAIARYLEIWNKMDGEYLRGEADFGTRESDIQHLDNATLLRLVKAE